MGKTDWGLLGTLLDERQSRLDSLPEEEREKVIEEINKAFSERSVRDWKPMAGETSHCNCCFCRSKRGYGL